MLSNTETILVRELIRALIAMQDVSLEKFTRNDPRATAKDFAHLFDRQNSSYSTDGLTIDERLAIAIDKVAKCVQELIPNEELSRHFSEILNEKYDIDRSKEENKSEDFIKSMAEVLHKG